MRRKSFPDLTTKAWYWGGFRTGRIRPQALVRFGQKSVVVPPVDSNPSSIRSGQSFALMSQNRHSGVLVNHADGLQCLVLRHLVAVTPPPGALLCSSQWRLGRQRLGLSDEVYCPVRAIHAGYQQDVVYSFTDSDEWRTY